MKSNQEFSASFTGSSVSGSSTAPSSLPRLGPTWRSGSQGSRKGFQPPPPVGTHSDAEAAKNTDQQQSSNRNTFSALMMDMDDDDINVERDDDTTPSNTVQPSASSRSGGGAGSSTTGSFLTRSEALRSAPSTGYSRSVSAGERGLSNSMASRGGGGGGGRSLRELASMMNTSTATTTGPGGTGRVTRGTSLTSTSGLEDATRSSSSIVSSLEQDKKVIRYTREKLLSMRPRPSADREISHLLKGGDGSIWFSKECLDPVCWDTFDPDEIWTESSREKRGSAILKTSIDRSSRRDANDDEVPRRGSALTSSVGRWERGIALPPPDERGGRGNNRNDNAEDPDDLWDDPLTSSRVAAAPDFSAFGGSLDDDPRATHAVDNAFDLTSFADAALKFEGSLHRGTTDNKVEDKQSIMDHESISHIVDPTRPLASRGTTIRSGSGDDVNVFEDFDDPIELVDDALSTIKSGEESQSLSSRLMQMIGVNNEEIIPDDSLGHTLEAKEEVESSSVALGTTTTFTTSLHSLSKNPWGTDSRNISTSESIDLAARLQKIELEKKREEEKETARLRQEEEDKRRAALQAQQAEMQARQQATVSTQQPQGHSQVELILMERVGTLLENSWGRSDLVSILSSLHKEDARVIPLLSSVDALRALLSRHPRRIALMKDPSYGTDIAVLGMTNTQFQQQQAAQEIQRRQIEQQQQLQAAAVARAKAEAEARAREVASKTVLIPDSPWYYADPHGNIQGPFTGEEMRQWLEAGYFKGDLPISQNPNGNFKALASIFPDLSIAFRIPESSSDEMTRIRSADEEARLKEEAVMRVERERQAQENARIQAEREDRIRAEEAAKSEARARLALQASMTNQMQSDKLKMMLGLGAGIPLSSDSGSQQLNSANEQGRSSIPSKSIEVTKSSLVDTVPSEPPKLAQAPPAPAWGGAGVGSSSQKLSVSEIQMEEARNAAQQREKLSRSSSGGWANIAASGGTTAWAGSATVKPAPATQTSAAAVSNTTTIISSSIPSTRMKEPSTGASTTPKQLAGQQVKANGQNTLDDFGANGKMTPTLETWCKDQMRKLSGNDDLTLIAFCMTLTDPAEIRQYLVAYLGSTPQVTSFATEFINRKNGSAPKQEMWESTVNNKKGRKKKASS